MIEKSHLHSFNSRNAFNTNMDKKNKENFGIKSESPTSSSKFLGWIKGLVNPLQNIPIISGIYSSINSDKPDSDRDFVQSSAGGFLYGGPIGAIAGFGNWVFEKLFDKTPTELVFDTLGISNLWKDKTSKTNTVENDLNLKNVDFSEKQNKTNMVEKEFKEHEKLGAKGMTFDYPKWSPLSYQATYKKQNKSLSSLYDNKTEISQNRISIDA